MLRFRRKKVASARSVTRRFVVFSVAGKDFGIDIGRVREAIRLGKVVSVPKAPSWLRGVMELRGRVIPIVDLGRRLDLTDGGSADQSHAKGVLVAIDDQVVGLAVGDVHEVIELGEDAISTPDQVIAAGIGQGFLEGVGKTSGGLLLLLAVEQLFTPTERSELSTVGAGDRAEP